MTDGTQDSEITSPSDEELAAAERLAQLLDATAATPSRVDAADTDDSRQLELLDTADVIVASRRPELDEISLESVLAEVEQRIETTRVRRKRIRLTLAAGSTVAAAAAVMLAVLPQSEQSPQMEAARTAAVAPAAKSAPIPAPPQTRAGAADVRTTAGRALRAAQLAWLDEQSAATQAELTAQLTSYRSTHLAMLQRRYAR